VRFIETKLPGAFVIELEPLEDSRGFFARTFCAREFSERALTHDFVQCSIAMNHRRGTVRGMHYQLPPASEVKLVRCTSGAVYDVIVDLRPDSPTHLQHIAVELTAQNRRSLYVPEMFAHGMQVLEDGSEVFYQINKSHEPAAARGLRYDDPKLGIQWPLPVSLVSARDANWPLLADSLCK
jgi:dTDP-4-dehydrorhamnose 3,5-epimerase